MTNNDKHPRSTERIAIAATFTAEPVADSLALWMRDLEFPAEVEFAPYNQIFQQLLDPSSEFGRNRAGVNVILLRLEDWRRAGDHSSDTEHSSASDLEGQLARNAVDLIGALRDAASRSAVPHVVVFCPASPEALADHSTKALLESFEEQIAGELGSISGIALARAEDFADYPVASYYDSERDRIGHIPYTPVFFAALGTVIARKIHALKTPPYKVIVLDCDNTVWKGVVGEDGVDGVEIPPPWKELQRRVVDLHTKGFLICLCSKNEECDALEVFERRADMLLKREHLVSWRINWQPKSENIKSLSAELNLGLDSFIFIDDNPVECEEVRSACPDVLTLRLPIDGDIEGFLRHIWAFDRLRVTSEDKQRTEMYKQEAERTRFQKQASTLDDFLAGLGLCVDINEPSAEQIPRAAQLTQRTNQFNFTTVRRSEGEFQRLAESGLESRVVEVRDRFGDYGLVGLMIFGNRDNALAIDTFLLSCRVLGRGVEHKMLNHLGTLAKERGVATVQAEYLPTKKNRPARDFLERAATEFKRTGEAGDTYEIPADFAAAIAYRPSEHAEAETEVKEETVKATARETLPPPGSSQKSRRFERIATELSKPEQILELVLSDVSRHSSRPADAPPYVAPRSETESELAEVWSRLLRFSPVGIGDDFFELGGTSLLAVDLFAQIERRFGKRLPLTTLIEAPTIQALCTRIGGSSEASDTLVLLRKGGDRPALFLIHDGDGETMLYRNLALRLDPGHAVYGLQPLASSGSPMLQTRITDMARHHVERIRSVQPEGPYLVGGMCAGGVIAFEVARQLEEEGSEVAMVALIDAADPEAAPRAWREASQRLQSFSAAFSGDPAMSTVSRILKIATKISKKVINTSTYLVSSRIQKLRDETKMKMFRHYGDRGRGIPSFLQGISVRTVYLFAEKDYRPTSFYRGELVLFRATEGVGNDEPYIDRFEDPLLGWAKRTTRSVRVFDVPGGHSSMLQEPNVEVMAEQVQAYIDEALDPGDEKAPKSAHAEPSLAGRRS